MSGPVSYVMLVMQRNETVRRSYRPFESDCIEYFDGKRGLKRYTCPTQCVCLPINCDLEVALCYPFEHITLFQCTSDVIHCEAK